MDVGAESSTESDSGYAARQGADQKTNKLARWQENGEWYATHHRANSERSADGQPGKSGHGEGGSGVAKG